MSLSWRAAAFHGVRSAMFCALFLHCARAALGKGETALQQERESQIRKALEKQIDVKFDELPLAQAVDVLRGKLGIPIEINRRSLDDVGLTTDTPMTISISGLSAKSILRHMLKQHDLTYEIRDEVLQITTPDYAGQNEQVVAYNVHDLVTPCGPRGGLDYDSLIELITVTVTPGSWEGSGPGPIHAFGGMLVLAQTDEVHDEVASLLAALRAARDIPTSSKESFSAIRVEGGSVESSIERALLQSTSLESTEAPLTKVLANLSEKHKIQILINERALDDAGLDADSILVNTQVEGITAGAALRLILQQHDLTWIIHDEVLEITTLDEANQELVLKVYPVGDLLQLAKVTDSARPRAFIGGMGAAVPAGTLDQNSVPLSEQGSSAAANPADIQRKNLGSSPGELLKQFGIREDTGTPVVIDVGFPSGWEGSEFNSLEETLTRTVDPERWDNVGGPGTISSFEVSEAFVIAQTEDVHQRVQDLLNQIRALKPQIVQQAQPNEPSDPDAESGASDMKLVIYRLPPADFGMSRQSDEELVEILRDVVEPESWRDTEKAYIKAASGLIVVRHHLRAQERIQKLLNEMLAGPFAGSGGF